MSTTLNRASRTLNTSKVLGVALSLLTASARELAPATFEPRSVRTPLRTTMACAVPPLIQALPTCTDPSAFMPKPPLTELSELAPSPP